MTAAVLLAQVDAQAMRALERIATAQVIMAAAMVLIGLIILGAAIVFFLQARTAQRMLQKTVDEMKPQLAPLTDRAKHVLDDVAGLTDNMRRKADDVLHTVEELRRSVERAAGATEDRMRRFSAVLDVVQTETEELLLDAAATAHGLQETARVLREDGGRRQGRALDPTEEETTP
jgi:biopolymer transport protein ExbB/TolQ